MKKNKHMKQKNICTRDYPITLRMEGWAASVAFIAASAASVGIACFCYLTARSKNK